LTADGVETLYIENNNGVFTVVVTGAAPTRAVHNVMILIEDIDPAATAEFNRTHLYFHSKDN